MRTTVFLLLLLAGLAAQAQDRCASADYAAAQKTAGTAAAENFLQKQTTAPGQKTASEGPVKIPVVVHLLYRDASQNLSDDQVKSQLEALNRDFRRTAADTLNTPERFRSLAADAEVEFYLATADPKGRATNGIVRKYSSTANWLANDKIKFSAQGGDDAWDAKSYLNIWVGNLISGAGYSSAPGGDASKDGIVINTSAFGTIGRSGYYDKGRTAVHEVGHWLGLKHIWGDAQCGDDGVTDTPPQSGYTQGCPSGVRNSCGNAVSGDMYMNYMDYTADACMNLFTQGQKKRMLAAFADGGPRASLLWSKGLKAPWVEGLPELEKQSGVSLYPNPAAAEITVLVAEDVIGKTICVYNAAGTLVQIVQVKSATVKINLTSFKAGLYFVKGEGFSQKFIKL